MYCFICSKTVRPKRGHDATTLHRCPECNNPEGYWSLIPLETREKLTEKETMKRTEWMIRSMAITAALLLFLVAGPALAQTGDVHFDGTCTDVEDGDISASLVWTSDVDGQVGVGATFDAPLTVGVHRINATCTDSVGGWAEVIVTYEVKPANNPPVVIIISPEDGGCQGPGCP